MAGKKRNWLKLAAIGLMLIAALLLAIKLLPVITPFFFALLFAYVLRPILMRMSALGIPDTLSILVIYFYLFSALYLFVFICLPLVSSQFQELLAYLPRLLNSLRGGLRNILDMMQSIELPAAVSNGVDQALAGLEEKTGGYMASLAERLPAMLRYLLYLVLMPILSYYMLKDRGSAARKMLALFSPGHRPELLRLLGDIDHLLRQFVCGYLLVSLVVAIMSAAFYYAVGVEYALVLGIIMGIADLIPYFGPFLGAIPAVLIALGQSPGLGLITAAGLIVLQQLEGLVITPKIMGDRIGLHPLTTIFAVMAGGYLFGILGTILAVPLAAALILILKYIYSRMVGFQQG